MIKDADQLSYTAHQFFIERTPVDRLLVMRDKRARSRIKISAKIQHPQ